MRRSMKSTRAVLLCTLCATAAAQEEDAQARQLRQQLAACPFKIVYESYREDNWELMCINADGTNPSNLTQTPDLDELYPHASPDGTKVVFLQDVGQGDNRTRDVCMMSIDGTDRVKVAENGRQPFWSPDGKIIAYATEPGARYPEGPYVNQGLYFFNVETKAVTQHPKPDVSGLLNPCWSPDGQWIICSAVRGLGFNKSIVAFEANGPKVAELIRSRAGPDDLYQCRPDIGPDGTRVAWGTGNTRHKDYMWVEVAEVDFTLPEPKIVERRKVVQVDFPQQTYHVDWSPDGKYIVYSQGSVGGRMQRAAPVIGTKAHGWDLWVVDPAVPNVAVQITHDGLSNKEPDWVFAESVCG